MKENATSPDGAAGALELEGYEYIEHLGETVLVRSGLYRASASQAQVVIEEIAGAVSEADGFAERFQERLALVTSLNHPGLIRILEGGQTPEGSFYVIKEQVAGFLLQPWMQAMPIEPASAHQLIINLAGTLEVFHSSGTGHGAVSAVNVWVNHDGDVLLDPFPVSSLLEPTQLVHFLGLEVVNTMPPEFLTGRASSPQGDIYNLGALYYELITGCAPRGAMDPTSPILELGPEIRSVMLKAMSTQPNERQQSMAEFCAPLLAISAASLSSPDEPTGEVPVEIKPPPAGARKRTVATWVVAGVLFAVTGLATYFSWPSRSEKLKLSDPVVVKPQEIASPDEIPPQPAMAITPQIVWQGSSDSGSKTTMVFTLVNLEEIRPLILRTSGPKVDQPGDESTVTQYHFVDDSGNRLSEAKDFPEVGASGPLLLSFELAEAAPKAVRLVLTGLKDKERLTSASNLVLLESVIAEHRPEPQPTAGKAPQNKPAATIRSGTPGAGDAYIYTAHFYLGSDVSLLKLQFGNAGKSVINCERLAFQCAFSTDENFDSLMPGKPGVMPYIGKDLAAGGFTSKWLGLDQTYLMPGKKLWTKHTFRLDTSDPALLENAKYLLVKISPNHWILESDYTNNVIVIPLQDPNQWQTVTQDPTDALGAEESKPAPAAQSQPKAEK